MDKSLEETIGAALVLGKATKAAACLLFLLVGEKDKTKLRDVILSELRGFRSLVGKENERKFLPAVLLSKAETVLKGGSS